MVRKLGQSMSKTAWVVYVVVCTYQKWSGCMCGVTYLGKRLHSVKEGKLVELECFFG